MKFRISTTLFVASVVIQMLMLSILIWNGIRLLESSHADMMYESVAQQNRLLVNSLVPTLATQDRALMNDTLSLLQDQQWVIYAEVFDRSNALMSAIGDHLHGLQDPHDKLIEEAARDGIFDTLTDIILAGQQLGTLHVGYSMSQIESLVSESKQQSTMIAAIALLLSLGLTLIIGLYWTNNLHRLKNGALMMREGDLRHRIDIDESGEMGEIANALNLLADHLLKSSEQLTRDNRYLDTLLNGVNAIVWEADAKSGLITFASAKWQKVTGIFEEEWIDINFLIEHSHPDDQKLLRFNFEKISDSVDEVSMEFRLIKRNGDEVWLRNIASSSYLKGEGMTLRGIMLDITEQKQVEEHAVFLGNHDAPCPLE